MSKLRFGISVSLDGFVAGPNQSTGNPLGEGGERLHEWAFPLEAFRRPHGMEGGEVNSSTPILEEGLEEVGAGIMGRTHVRRRDARQVPRGPAGLRVGRAAAVSVLHMT